MVMNVLNELKLGNCTTRLMKNFLKIMSKMSGSDRGEHKHQSTFLMTIKRMADNLAGTVSVASPLGLLCSLPMTSLKWAYLSFAWIMNTVIGSGGSKTVFRSSHSLVYKEIVNPNDHPLVWTGMKRGNAAIVEVKQQEPYKNDIYLPRELYTFLKQISMFAQTACTTIRGKLTWSANSTMNIRDFNERVALGDNIFTALYEEKYELLIKRWNKLSASQKLKYKDHLVETSGVLYLKDNTNDKTYSLKDHNLCV